MAMLQFISGGIEQVRRLLRYRVCSYEKMTTCTICPGQNPFGAGSFHCFLTCWVAKMCSENDHRTVHTLYPPFVHQVAVPSTIHCDHLIEAQTGGKDDLSRAKVN